MAANFGKLAGLIVGLVFGWVWIQDSFADAVLVALTGLIGYLIGAVLTGEIDVVEVLARRRR
ncbi:MAG: hypothetical protein NVS2B16_31220 [Chloroflexota bacterium]